MSQNRYSRTHSFSTSDAYGYGTGYPSNFGDEDDIELDDDEFLSDGFDDDLMQGSSNRNSSEYDSSQCIRRAHHNRLEQKRRAFIRDSYTDLKDVMPEFKGKKLSRANILIHVRRKVDENRKFIFELRRQYEAKKTENDREEREVMNMERQLSAIENNGAYLVDMQHSTPPLANIGINLISGIQRHVINRPGHAAQHVNCNSNAQESNESHYSDENSFENHNRLPINSTGASSNTPSISSLTDSPINSGTSSLCSTNAPTLVASNQLLSHCNTSEDNSNGTWATNNASTPDIPTLQPAEQIDTKPNISDLASIIKTSPSVIASSHLAPLATSPDLSNRKLVKNESQNENLINQATDVVIKEENDLERMTSNDLDVTKKPTIRQAGISVAQPMVTRRMRSCSMSINHEDEVDGNDQNFLKNNVENKRSFIMTTPGAHSSQATKRICVTAISSGNTPLRTANIPIGTSVVSLHKSASGSPVAKRS